MSKHIIKNSADNLKDYKKTHYMSKDGVWHNIEKTSFDGGFGGVAKILCLFLVLLLIVALLRSILGAEPIYFSSFLEMLSNVPSVDLLVSIKDLTITADWGIFNFFRNFLNMGGSIISVLSFCFTGLLNITIFILYFVRYLFFV